MKKQTKYKMNLGKGYTNAFKVVWLKKNKPKKTSNMFVWIMYMSIWCSYLRYYIHVTWVTPSSWSNCPSSSSLNTPSLLPNPGKPPYWEDPSLIQHCLEGDKWNSSGGCPVSTGWEVAVSNPTLLLETLPLSSPVTCLKDFFWNTRGCLMLAHLEAF